MTKTRKEEIIENLQKIINTFEPTEAEPELTMFGLISRYNKTYDNTEFIGGSWAKDNGFELN